MSFSDGYELKMLTLVVVVLISVFLSVVTLLVLLLGAIA